MLGEFLGVFRVKLGVLQPATQCFLLVRTWFSGDYALIVVKARDAATSFPPRTAAFDDVSYISSGQIPARTISAFYVVDGEYLYLLQIRPWRGIHGTELSFLSR
jgi:hypothetical protein